MFEEIVTEFSYFYYIKDFINWLVLWSYFFCVCPRDLQLHVRWQLGIIKIDGEEAQDAVSWLVLSFTFFGFPYLI